MDDTPKTATSDYGQLTERDCKDMDIVPGINGVLVETDNLKTHIRARISAGPSYWKPDHLEKLREMEFELVAIEQRLMKLRDAE